MTYLSFKQGLAAVRNVIKAFAHRHTRYLRAGSWHRSILKLKIYSEPWHEISNNVVCATSKGSHHPAHTRSLIRAFASRLNIL